MNGFMILLLCGLITISFACKQQEPELTFPAPKRIIGGITPMTKEDMNEMMFQDSLMEVMKKLQGANKCHSFRLVGIVEATRQVVAGMKYTMKLEVTPIPSTENAHECSDVCYSNVSGNKQVTATVLFRAWYDPQHHITFTSNDESRGDFDRDGKMLLSCAKPKWTKLTPDEMESEQFQEAVRHAIARLNRDVTKCFRVELLEVISGRCSIGSRLEYEWDMAVRKIYDESLPGCRGFCADECSSREVYSVTAFMDSSQGGTPEISNIKYKEPFHM